VIPRPAVLLAREPGTSQAPVPICRFLIVTALSAASAAEGQSNLVVVSRSAPCIRSAVAAGLKTVDLDLHRDVAAISSGSAGERG